MGQYHKVFNLDKKQVLHPHKLGCGLKLWEFGTEGGVVTALSYLLAASAGRGGGDWDKGGPLAGSWAGDRIAIIGDYADEKDVPGVDAKTLYSDEGYADISEKVRAEFPEGIKSEAW